jgi:prevent-host-death family protein
VLEVRLPTRRSQITQIGAFEAKTRLSELLRKVERGERFTITLRGRPIAELAPLPQASQRMDEVLNRLMNPPIEGIPGDTVLDWIHDGRK